MFLCPLKNSILSAKICVIAFVSGIVISPILGVIAAIVSLAYFTRQRHHYQASAVKSPIIPTKKLNFPVMFDPKIKDLQLVILSHLNARELGIISRVNKSWKANATSEVAWKFIQFYRDNDNEMIQWKGENGLSYQYSHRQMVIRKIQIGLSAIHEYDQIAFGKSELFFFPIVFWKSRERTMNLFLVANAEERKLGLLKIGKYAFNYTVELFQLFLAMQRHGFPTLVHAEQLVIKTKHLFQNPYPFIVLEALYVKLGNEPKAAQMQQIVRELTAITCAQIEEERKEVASTRVLFKLKPLDMVLQAAE